MTANLDLAESRQLYMRGLERLAELPEVAMLAGRRVGILGCTGLIGSALLEILMRSNASALASNPIKIYGIARRPVYPLQGYRFIAMSVTDRHALDSIPDLDYTVYVAGTASDYLRRPKETLETQIIGLENALSRVGNTSRFVYISSTRVYGRQNSMEPITEETAAQVPPMHLDNLYDSAKRFGESLCLWYARFRDYQAVVARPSNIYGPQVILRSETAITDLIRQAMELRITLKGHPASMRNYCCVLDIAQGILKTLVHGSAGRAYNIGSNEHLSTLELAQQIAAAFPVPIEIDAPATDAAPSIQRISIDRAITELGYAPEFIFGPLAPYIVANTVQGILEPEDT